MLVTRSPDPDPGRAYFSSVPAAASLVNRLTPNMIKFESVAIVIGEEIHPESTKLHPVMISGKPT
jgi:hypothetical protein